MDMFRGFFWYDGISDFFFVLKGFKEFVWVLNIEVDLFFF